MSEVETKSLSARAYEPLEPGEAYPPLIPATSTAPELTPRSLIWGVLFCVIYCGFSVFRAEGRTSDGSRHPNLDPYDRAGPHL